MDDRDQISDRAFYDVLDEKYEHCDITGTLVNAPTIGKLKPIQCVQ